MKFNGAFAAFNFSISPSPRSKSKRTIWLFLVYAVSFSAFLRAGKCRRAEFAAAEVIFMHKSMKKLFSIYGHSQGKYVNWGEFIPGCEKINIYGTATLRFPPFLVGCLFSVNEIHRLPPRSIKLMPKRDQGISWTSNISFQILIFIANVTIKVPFIGLQPVSFFRVIVLYEESCTNPLLCSSWDKSSRNAFYLLTRHWSRWPKFSLSLFDCN